LIVFCSPRCETVLGIPRLETVLGIPRYARDGRLSVLGLHTNRELRGFFAIREPITESREQRFVSANTLAENRSPKADNWGLPRTDNRPDRAKRWPPRTIFFTPARTGYRRVTKQVHTSPHVWIDCVQLHCSLPRRVWN